MSLQKLKLQHEKIGQTIEAANKCMPFQAMTLAKRAAEESHALLGGILDRLESMEAANDES